MLVVEEVGDALIISLKKDLDGTIYLVLPDMPILEVPDPAYPFMFCLSIVGQMAKAFGRESLSAKEVVIILFMLIYVGFHLLHFTLSTLTSLIF